MTIYSSPCFIYSTIQPGIVNQLPSQKLKLYSNYATATVVRFPFSGNAIPVANTLTVNIVSGTPRTLILNGSLILENSYYQFIILPGGLSSADENDDGLVSLEIKFLLQLTIP